MKRNRRICIACLLACLMCVCPSLQAQDSLPQLPPRDRNSGPGIRKFCDAAADEIYSGCRLDAFSIQGNA